MKKIIYISLTILSIGFASTCSDNPQEITAPKVEDCKSIDCPKCGNKNCIYEQIEEEMENAGAEGTDKEIYDAASRVFILRNITDSPTMKLILSNYYL